MAACTLTLIADRGPVRFWKKPLWSRGGGGCNPTPRVAGLGSGSGETQAQDGGKQEHVRADSNPSVKQVKGDKYEGWSAALLPDPEPSWRVGSARRAVPGDGEPGGVTLTLLRGGTWKPIQNETACFICVQIGEVL